ncbi:MAG: hypothetical protein IJ224_04095 [Lachnospiraceae bacterium]|nr:hypothetical protein [Lachnospiraceae bacterium]
MKKKIFCAMLVLSLGLLTACGDDKDSSDNKVFSKPETTAEATTEATTEAPTEATIETTTNEPAATEVITEDITEETDIQDGSTEETGVSGNGNCVTVSYLSDYTMSLDGVDFVTLSETAPIESILFSTEEKVTDFKVISLYMQDVDADGKPVYLYMEVYSKDELTPEHPLCVDVTFYGDMPNWGVSYVDPNGKTRYFAIEISGFDGSLLFTEFNDQ